MHKCFVFPTQYVITIKVCKGHILLKTRNVSNDANAPPTLSKLTLCKFNCFPLEIKKTFQEYKILHIPTSK